MAIHARDTPRLATIITAAYKWGWSKEHIVALLKDAIATKHTYYSAKGMDIAMVLHELSSGSQPFSAAEGCGTARAVQMQMLPLKVLYKMENEISSV